MSIAMRVYSRPLRVLQAGFVMGCDVAKYLRIYHTYAEFKSNFHVFHQMAPHPKSSRPWEVFSTDDVGLHLRSSKGKSYVLVIVDYRTSSAFAREVEGIFLLFGVPFYQFSLFKSRLQIRKHRYIRMRTFRKLLCTHTIEQGISFPPTQ